MKKKKKTVLIVLTVVVVLVFVAFLGVGGWYLYMSHQYSNKFFPGTYINGIDCGEMSIYEAKKVVAEQVEDYSVTVTDQDGKTETIAGADIGYQYVDDGEINKIMQEQNPFTWIKNKNVEKDHEVSKQIQFDEKLLREKLMSIDFMIPENQTAPQDAYMTMQDGKFAIIPEVAGSQIDSEVVYKALAETVQNSREGINVAELGAYAKPTILQDNADLIATRDTYNTYLATNVTYTIGNDTATLDSSTILTWFDQDENGNYSWNADKAASNINAFIQALSDKYDTYGKPVSFVSTRGKSVTLSSKILGWQIDADGEAASLTEYVNTGQTVSREINYLHTGISRENNGIGKTYVEVDLGKQHMYYYKNGSLIFEADFISGLPSDPDRKTPEGIYQLYYKQRDHVMKAADGSYETPCSYWMPFNGGIGFHDAIWQTEGFGGNLYETRGSHGCINMSLENAAKLYDLISAKTLILCFY
ncbi:MAG: L,D-transpeptidase family protein [Lachnospiraceae bacterium]|nr:L,D-transpeptidase family protein [Lachnospiraceae bacterium]